MGSPTKFRVYQKIKYLMILFVTYILLVGQTALLKTFNVWSVFVFLLNFQNNQEITDPNGFQMWPK